MKYSPRNIKALPTFMAPIPAKTMAVTSVRGIVFPRHANLERQVVPFATVISKGIQTQNTPILHMAVVARNTCVKKFTVVGFQNKIQPKYRLILS